jgi:hypothetical protein
MSDERRTQAPPATERSARESPAGATERSARESPAGTTGPPLAAFRAAAIFLIAMWARTTPATEHSSVIANAV